MTNEVGGIERTITLFKDPSWTSTPGELVIVPPGLSLERQWYLHDKIREFCPDHCKDLVCPRPTEPTMLNKNTLGVKKVRGQEEAAF